MATLEKIYWARSTFKPEVNQETFVNMAYESMRKWCDPGEETLPPLLKLADFEQMFRSNPDAKLVPCGIDVHHSTSKEETKKMLFRETSTDASLSLVASCACKQTRGNALKGLICPHCHTEVRDACASDIDFKSWIEIPDFLPAFLHPAAYRVLGKWMGVIEGTRTKKVIDALLNPDEDLPRQYSQLGQGMTYFMNNFDDIIAFFMKKNSSKGKLRRNEHIRRYIQAYRDKLFVRHLPILNQDLHIITTSGTSLSYSDSASEYIYEACVELSSAVYNYHNNLRAGGTGVGFYTEQGIYSVYHAYHEYLNDILKVKISGKPGIVRKTILAQRVNNSFRAVIVPITGVHDPDECHIPWRVAVGSYELQIMAVLMNVFNISYVEAKQRIHKALVKFDEKVSEAIDYLLKCCPFKGLPLLLGRNPTLRHGSIQLLFATVVKRDPRDKTTAISPFIISAPNAELIGPHGSDAHVRTSSNCGDTLKPNATIVAARQAMMDIKSRDVTMSYRSAAKTSLRDVGFID